MNIVKAYTKGFGEANRHFGMIALIYLSNLFLALILAFAFRDMLQTGFGGSAASDSLLQGFNYTTWHDFLNQNNLAFSTIMAQVKWYGIAYLIITVFLNGGILSAFRTGNFKRSDFFGSAAHHFFRFFRLSAYMICFQLLVVLLVWFPVTLLFDGFFDTMKTDRALFFAFGGIFLFSLLLFGLLKIISDYAKFHIFLRKQKTVLPAIWSATKYVFRRFFKLYALFLMLLVAPLVAFAVYALLNHWIGMNSAVSILIMFLVQQVFVFTRGWLRVWRLGGQYHVYFADYAQEQIQTKAKIETWDKQAVETTQREDKKHQQKEIQQKQKKVQTTVDAVSQSLEAMRQKLSHVEALTRQVEKQRQSQAPKPPENQKESKKTESKEEEWEILDDSKNQPEENDKKDDYFELI